VDAILHVATLELKTGSPDAYDVLASPPSNWLAASAGRRAPLLKPMEVRSIAQMRVAIASMVRWMNTHGYAHLRIKLVQRIGWNLRPDLHIPSAHIAPPDPL